MNSSPDTWGELPLPVEAILIVPGWAFASAMNCATVVAGTDGWTTMTRGSRVMPDRRDIAQEVEAEIGIKRCADRVGRTDEQKRVTVGGGAHDRLGGEIAGALVRFSTTNG